MLRHEHGMSAPWRLPPVVLDHPRREALVDDLPRMIDHRLQPVPHHVISIRGAQSKPPAKWRRRQSLEQAVKVTLLHC
jgi:hypothetical protein